MNGYANAETFFAASNILNIENLYISARRMINSFQLRNLFVSAIENGIIVDADEIDIEAIEFQEILDAVIDDE